jgi:hypothetical protein
MPDASRTRTGLSRTLALAVIACALLARLLVPQGWMPVETARGWTLTLCSGSGPMQMGDASAAAMKPMHHGGDDRDHAPGDHPCAFSSLALALDEPPLPLLDLPRPLLGAWTAWAGFAVAIGRGLAAPPPPATGPPLA